MSRLRWELCKIWKCSVDDDRFKNINNAQILWYFEMLERDRQDKFEWWREFVEYNASFMNPESVKKLREARDDGGHFKATDNLSEKIKEGSLFDDPIIRDIQEKYKNTNNVDDNRRGPMNNIKSPLYDVIKDI